MTFDRPGWLAVGIVLLGAGQAAADGPSAAELVRSIRRQEAWVDRVESLWIKASVAWERTPRGIAKRRRELQQQFPGQNLDAMPDLRPMGAQRSELAFDQTRVRTRDLWPWGVDDLRVWDGKRYLGQDHYEKTPERDGYLISPSPEQRLHGVFNNLSCFRASAHLSWWIPPKDHEESIRLMGAPEDFAYAGHETFDGVECDVVCAWGIWHRYYISIADGRLRGVKEGTQTRPDFVQKLLTFFEGEGRVFRDERALGEWFKSLEPDEARAVNRRLAARMGALTEPIFEFGLADYKEVAPGCWLPMTQTCIIRFIDEDGSNAIDLKKVIKITDIHINERLPDSLFSIEFREGARVHDETHNPPLKYRYKPSFTREEWAAIVAEGKTHAARDKARERKLSALIGRPAPEFPLNATWLNGKPLKWSDLAGKPVVLDFWAEWCAPCRNDLPTLSALHKKRADNGVIIIGVHPPGSDVDAIRKVINDFDLGYATCIDVRPFEQAAGWGEFSGQLGVDRIPFAIFVDSQGKIAATGELSEVLSKASPRK